MLPELHLTIKNLLYTKGALPRDEVDVTFEMPTREWLDALVKPTINLFLFEIDENTDLRQTAVQTGRTHDGGNGRVVGMHRMPVRRFDLRYMVSAPNTEIDHEHILLWRTLITLLRYPQMPLDVLEGTVVGALQDSGRVKADVEIRIPRRAADLTLGDIRTYLEGIQNIGRVRDGLMALTLDPPFSGQVARLKEGPRLHDLWGAFELPPRPALIYTVTVPIELDIIETMPLVLRQVTRYTGPGNDGLRPDLVSARDPERALRPLDGVRELSIRTRELGSISGVLRNSQGQPLTGAKIVADNDTIDPVRTDDEGRYTLRGVPPGTLHLRILRESLSPVLVTLSVPDERYDIELE